MKRLARRGDELHRVLVEQRVGRLGCFQRAAFQRGNARQLAFPRLQLLLGDFHVGKQHLALRRHRHAAGAAHQQLAAQLFLQPVQGAGHIGLAHAQHIGRAGYTVIFADIVK